MSPSFQLDTATPVEEEASVLLQKTSQVSLDFVTEPVKSKAEEENLTVQFPRKVVDQMIKMIGPANPNWLQLNQLTVAANEPVYGATKLRKMLFETNQLIVCPGVYDGLSARTAMELGFNALYMVSTPLIGLSVLTD